MAGWASCPKHRDIFKSNLAIRPKRQVYNSCVLPAMTSGAETWTLTKQAQNKLAAAQTKMERSMLNITYKDRKTNIWVRERTKVIDIISNVRKIKWSWAHQPPQRRPMDVACHHVETIRQENTTRDASQLAERRPGQILERRDLAEDNTIQAKCMLRLCPTTGHYGCPMMMMSHILAMYVNSCTFICGAGSPNQWHVAQYDIDWEPFEVGDGHFIEFTFSYYLNFSIC